MESINTFVLVNSARSLRGIMENPVHVQGRPGNQTRSEPTTRILFAARVPAIVVIVRLEKVKGPRNSAGKDEADTHNMR